MQNKNPYIEQQTNKQKESSCQQIQTAVHHGHQQLIRETFPFLPLPPPPQCRSEMDLCPACENNLWEYCNRQVKAIQFSWESFLPSEMKKKGKEYPNTILNYLVHVLNISWTVTFLFSLTYCPSSPQTVGGGTKEKYFTNKWEDVHLSPIIEFRNTKSTLVIEIMDLPLFIKR